MPKFKKHARAIYTNKKTLELHGMSFGYGNDEWWEDKLKHDVNMEEYRCVALEVLSRKYWLFGKPVWKFKKPR